MSIAGVDEKVLATIQIDKDIHCWLEQLAVVKEGQRFDLSAQVNQLLRIAKDANQSSAAKSHKAIRSEMRIEQIQMIKSILQTCVESLMIMRNQFLSDPEAQAKLTQEVKEMLCRQFDKLSDEELVKECLS